MTDNFNGHLVQDDEPQKLFLLTTEGVPGIQPGVGVFAATTKDKGLEVETVDLREFIPGVTASAEAGTRLVTDVPSFLAELVRYSIDPQFSTLWGDETKGRVEAIYNDHANDGAGLRDNRLRLELRADQDWTAWHQLSGQYLRQEEFGDRVEELLHTVVEPAQADLMEVIDSIRATSKGSFESKISRADGGQQLEYKEDVSTTAGKSGQLEVPKTVTLAIRPWEGLDTYKVEGWFRLRVQNGQLSLAIKLKPTRSILRAAWADVITQIEQHLDGKPVLATRFDR
ncbi:hypothetical protein SEA_ZIRINKA_50 [Gordonia phage Zirinka]|uniref:DUF2303 family protein n=15 Tax=Caudoviricetes TaxID=2731619 RepID=A0A4Y5TYH7_9CAUD|nr:hypothetical protein SEA_ZIRINKA_50 [Gordonia phage Zirinka]YP_009301415.1 hypothetical protein SEA_KITA_54 [Gordonia phage Kita]YP_009303043.1 hypothetical protein SEA_SOILASSASSIN_48 [Gordonia phage SoilAssassin]YP_009595806.1 hypothetical protein FDH00_gp48 [Gordonia phage Attis]YP_010653084.1 hypothetical protein PP489_gp50 [Gordonia phage Polly]YP_010653545.1 hypothetical protein PP495_gp46 [Gordonia phage Pickett]YP_010653621.1 hypothetical protein PP496_gp48 [Gordonia phage Yeet412]